MIDMYDWIYCDRVCTCAHPDSDSDSDSDPEAESQVWKAENTLVSNRPFLPEKPSSLQAN